MIQPALTERLAELHRRDLLRHANQCQAGRAVRSYRCTPSARPATRSTGALRRAARMIARWA